MQNQTHPSEAHSTRGQHHLQFELPAQPSKPQPQQARSPRKGILLESTGTPRHGDSDSLHNGRAAGGQPSPGPIWQSSEGSTLRIKTTPRRSGVHRGSPRKAHSKFLIDNDEDVRAIAGAAQQILQGDSEALTKLSRGSPRRTGSNTLSPAWSGTPAAAATPCFAERASTRSRGAAGIVEALERHLSERQSFSRAREGSTSPSSRHKSSPLLPPMDPVNPLTPVEIHPPLSARRPSLASTPRGLSDPYRVPSSPSPAFNHRGISSERRKSSTPRSTASSLGPITPHYIPTAPLSRGGSQGTRPQRHYSLAELPHESEKVVVLAALQDPPGEASSARPQTGTSTASQKSKTMWMEWRDPLIPALRANISTARMIRKAPESNFLQALNMKQDADTEELYSGNYYEDIAHANDLLRHVKGLEVDHNIARVEAFLNARSNGRQWRVPPEVSRAAQQRPHFMLGNGGIDWSVLTNVETASLPVGHEDANKHSQSGILQLIESHGRALESHCRADIVEDTMKTIHWGDRASSVEKGGLLQLSESMDETAARIPKYMKMIEKGKELCAMMSSDKLQEQVLEAGATAAAAGVEARQCVAYFVETMKSGDDNWIKDVAKDECAKEISVERLDEALDELYREKQSANILKEKQIAERQKRGMAARGAALKPEMTILDSTTMEKIQELRQQNRRHFDKGMDHQDVLKHIKFHKNIRYMRYKTSNFKAGVLKNKMADGLDQESRWKLERADGGMENEDENITFQKEKIDTNYYLHVEVLEASGLPKMDSEKLAPAYNDTYVRLTLKANDGVASIRADMVYTTPVVWGKEDPVFNAAFDFDVPPPHKVDNCSLHVEVFDVDVGGYGGGNEDHIVGQVDFSVIKDNIRSMPLEKEFNDWSLLYNKDGSRVRHNMGDPCANKLGKDSKLKIKMVFTKRLPKGLDEYCMTLQMSMRCMIARKKLREEKVTHADIHNRAAMLPTYQEDLYTLRIWEAYTKCCNELKTHVIGSLKSQVHHQSLSLRHYSMTYVGVTALSSLVEAMCLSNHLQSLELVDNNLRGTGIETIAQALQSGEDCLKQLHIGKNPVMTESKDYKTLNTLDNKLGSGMAGPNAIAQIVRQSTKLAMLSITDCFMGDVAVSTVAAEVANHPSLTALRLDSTNSEFPSSMIKSVQMLGKALAAGHILDFSYINNSLFGKDAFALFGDGSLNQHGILRSTTLCKLNLKSNGLFKYEGPAALLAKYIASESCILDYLNVEDNLMGVKDATLIGDALVQNKLLKNIVVSRNNFGRAGYTPIMQHRGRRKVLLQGAAMVKAESSELPVARTLEDILQLFQQFDENGDGTMDFGEMSSFMKLLGNDWNDEKLRIVFDEILDGSSDMQVDFNAFYMWYSSKVIVNNVEGNDIINVHMSDCGVQIKSAHFNVNDVSGEFDLDMTLSKSRAIMLLLMKQVYAGLGKFVEGSSYTEKQKGNDLERKWVEIEVSQDISSWVIPNQGFLVFEFESTKPPAHEFLDSRAVVAVRDAFRKPDSSMLDRRLVVDKYFEDKRTKLNSLQAIELLKILAISCGDNLERLETLSRERIHFVVSVYRGLKDWKHASALLEELNAEERVEAELQLGYPPYIFTPLNPTGRHRLRLNKVREREIALSLLEIREKEVFKVKQMHKDLKDHKGGPRTNIERIFRNTRFNGSPFHYVDSWRVPLKGVLELDFVQVSRATASDVAMESDKFATLLESLKQLPQSSDRIQCIRAMSEDHFFNCLQALALVELFDIIYLPDKFLRAEVAVTLWARIVDWRGFHTLLRHLGPVGHQDAVRRLGAINLFQDSVVSAVGYWNLDLQVPEERWAMQEIVHLASVEQGDNILHGSLDGSDFDVPAEWLVNVPSTPGKVSFYYGRSQAVSDELLSANGLGIPSAPKPLPNSDRATGLVHFPPKFRMPTLPKEEEWSYERDGTAGTWVQVEKIRHIIEKMAEVAHTPEELFSIMDADGGQELSREELSQSLFQIGVWLPPSEMKIILDILDLDKSGDIDGHELTLFWNQAPPFRYGDDAQKRYWLSRGISLEVYAMMLPFYDLRNVYDWQSIALYDMRAHNYTHKPFAKGWIKHISSRQGPRNWARNKVWMAVQASFSAQGLRRKSILAPAMALLEARHTEKELIDAENKEELTPRTRSKLNTPSGPLAGNLARGEG